MTFNAEAYLKANPDVAASGMSAEQHYQNYGQYEGRDPGGATSGAQTNYYDNQNWVAAQATQGDKDVWGRSAGGTGMNNYFQANPDVAKEYEKVKLAGGDISAEDYAIWHYDNHGRFDGRGGVLPTGQTTFERQLGSPGGTFYDIYAGAPTLDDVGVFVNPVRGQYSKNIGQYQQDYGNRYGQVGPWGQFLTENEARSWAAQNAGKIDSYMSGYKPTWIDDSKAAFSGSQAGSYNWQAATLPGYRPSPSTAPGGGGSSSVASGPGGSSSGTPTGLVGGAFQQWGVTAPQTVQSQAAGIANADGTLMQQALGRAMQAMNERGLVNSTLAIQAGQDAVLDRAIQIAQQDAATNAEAAKFNAGQSNAWTLAQQELAEKASQFTRELAAKYDLAKFDLESRQALAATEREYQQQLATDRAFQEQYQMYVDALFKIDSDPELSAEAKTARKQEQLNLLKNYAAIRGLNLSQYLTFSTPTATAPAPAPAAATGLVSQADNFGI